MNLMESIVVAFEGIYANKMRAVLTMLGVIIGVGAVIAMLAIATGAREQTEGRFQQMGTNVMMIMSGQARNGAVRGGFGSSQTLTLEDAKALVAGSDAIAKVAPEVSGRQQVKYRNQNTNTSILGVTPDYPAVRNYSVQQGKFIDDADIKRMRKVAVIGTTTATDLFGDDSPVGKSIRIKGIEFEVVGLLASKGAAGPMGDQDDQIMIPITTAMRRVNGTRFVRSINVQVKSLDVMEQATSDATTVLRKRHRLAEGANNDFNIRNPTEYMEMAKASNATFTLLLGGIASISLLVGGIGIMNIMLVSVTERTREIGLRKAIGARRRDILRQFLIESLVLSLLGGLLGIVAGLLGAWVLQITTEWVLKVSVSSVVLSFSFAAAVGIFFGLYPAVQASRLRPIDALRYE